MAFLLRLLSRLQIQKWLIPEHKCTTGPVEALIVVAMDVAVDLVAADLYRRAVLIYEDQMSSKTTKR